MSVVSMKALLEAGVHFGHRTSRWNPKMRPYIFTERSGIHIIDLQQTVANLNDYAAMIRNVVSDGGQVLFVGTKRQAQAAVQAEADRCNMPYVNQRWLGGTITNWATIKNRLDYLLQMERRIDAGEFRNLSKKEQLSIDREVEKLNRRLGGLKIMSKLPKLIFVVDTNTEELAVREASKLKIPIVGMVDTNSNPDPIDYVIPCNDDAIRSVKLLVSVIADAAIEGLRIREVDMVDTGKVSEAELAEMEQYLGPSTLAKLQPSEEEAAAAALAAAEAEAAVVEAAITEEVAEELAAEIVEEAVAEEAVVEAAAVEEAVAEVAVVEAVIEEAIVEEAAEEAVIEAVEEAAIEEAAIEESVIEEVVEEIEEIEAIEATADVEDATDA